MPDKPQNLVALHAAILSGLQAKLSPVTVQAYPIIRRQIALPAVLLELSGLEPSNDSGTGETAFIGRFSAFVVADPTLLDAYLQVRELAARVAVAITHENWGLPIGVARYLQSGGDGFKPEIEASVIWSG
jgi:hypothetical protein